MTVSFKMTLINLGLVNSLRCERHEQTSEKVSHILCNCEAMATLWFRHLGQHFMKPGDFEDISISRILHLVQWAGPVKAWAQGHTKDWYRSNCTGHCTVHTSLLILFNSCNCVLLNVFRTDIFLQIDDCKKGQLVWRVDFHSSKYDNILYKLVTP